MISSELLLRLAASFMAGSAIVALVTALADIYGEGPAGFLGGLPTSGGVSLLSIGLTQSTTAAIQATTLFPLGFSSTFAFLLFYTIPSRSRFWIRMPIALALWLPTSVGIAVWGPNDFVVSVLAGVAIALVVLFARRRIVTKESTIASTKPSAKLTILRGALGGFVVMSVVIMSEISGPVAGGVFAAAPAIWSSSLYVTSRAKGMEFSRSLTRTFMQTGILTVIPYAIAARYFFSVYGIWLGTLFAYIAISPLAFLAWRLTNKQRKTSRD